MPKTGFLCARHAVELTWAMTGSSAKESSSQTYAAAAEQNLKDIQQKAEKAGGQEQEYVTRAVASIRASIRSLDIAYKSRELNFQENEKLRSVSLDEVKALEEFGKTGGDFLKSLPTIAITTGAGVLTLNQVATLSDWQSWLLGIIFAGAGYLANLRLVKRSQRTKKRLYVDQDYERNQYYEHYLSRVKTTLISLHGDVERVHTAVFGQAYDPTANAIQVVDQVLRGVQAHACLYVHKHKREGRITPELWPRCETGGEAARSCPIWEGPPP